MFFFSCINVRHAKNRVEVQVFAQNQRKVWHFILSPFHRQLVVEHLFACSRAKLCKSDIVY